MRRRDLLNIVGGVAVWPLRALAQQSEKIWRFGFLTPSIRPTPQDCDSISAAFMRGMVMSRLRKVMLPLAAAFFFVSAAPLALAPLSAWAGPREDCFSATAEPEAKIKGCTFVLQQRASSSGNPQTAFAYNNRCLGHNKLGQYDLAIDDCTKSIDLKNPGSQIPYKNRGDAYIGKGDYVSAVADYTRAIELLPSYDQAHQALAAATRLRDEPVKGPRADHGKVEIVPPVPHSQRVTSVAFSPDGTLILSGSDDGKLKLWQASTGRLIRTLRGHERNFAGVASVVFSPNGNWALSGGSDTAVKLWDVATGEFIQGFYGHTKAVTAVAFAPDGKRIASASFDNTVVVWDAVKGGRLFAFKGHVGAVTAVAFSPDGTRILSGAGTQLYPRRADNSAKLWDTTTGRIIQTFRHADELASVSISPDGTRVLTGSNDKTMKLWDAASGRLLHSFGGYSYPVYSVTFSPDGADVLSGNLDGIKLYNATSGHLMRDFKDATGVSSARFSPEGKRVASGTFQNTVELWDSTTGQRMDVPGNPDSQASPTAVGFTLDNAHVVSGSESELRLWDIPNGVRIFAEDSTRIAVSNGGNRILAGGDHKLRIVDAVTGANIRTISGIPNSLNAVAFSPDAQRVIAGLGHGSDAATPDWGKIKMWDASSGQLLTTIRGHGGGVSKPAFKGVGAVAFSPDGTRVVTGGAADGTSTNAPIGNGKVRFWDPATGQLLRNVDAQYYDVTSLAFSRDGSLIATGSGYDPIVQGRLITSIQTLRIWEASTGRLLHSIGPNAQVNAVAFSPDGRQVLSGSDDNQLILWDSASGQVIRRFDGHSGSITAATFSADGARVLSASGDGTVRVWNPGTGELLVTLIGNADGEWLQLTQEGFFAGSSGGGRLLSVARGLELYSIEQFYQSLYRPDLVREKLAGDPRGLVRDAAANLDLTKALASGNAPVVRIVSPAAGVSAANGQLVAEVEIEARGGGVGRIEWRINGLTVGVETLTSQPLAGQPVRVTRALVLNAGDNLVEVVAYNSINLIASVPARVAVAGPAAAPATPSTEPRLFVLAAGLNDYADRRFRLALAVNDANVLAQAFVEANKGLYRHVEVKVLRDAEVTRDRLDAAFNEIVAKIAPTDTFVLYLAGHGKTVDGRYYFIPQNFKVDGELSDIAIDAAVKTQGISQEQWQRWFALVPARRSMILFDTCESGTLTGDQSETKALERSGANDRLAQATGRSIITASGGAEAAFEGYNGHGLFTYNVLEALDRADSDGSGTIEVAELAAYVYAQVTSISERVFKQRQEPQMKITLNYPLTRQTRILSNDAPAIAANDKPKVQLAHTAQLQIKPSSGATVVRSLAPNTAVTVLRSEGGWSLVAAEGRPLGYVATRDLGPLQ